MSLAFIPVASGWPGAALFALILTFGPVSGAHFNPAVTIASAFEGGIRWRHVPAYLMAQTGGAFLGVAAANVMYSYCERHVCWHSPG